MRVGEWRQRWRPHPTTAGHLSTVVRSCRRGHRVTPCSLALTRYGCFNAGANAAGPKGLMASRAGELLRMPEQPQQATFLELFSERW
jgi:hypothetical protein